MSIDTLIDRLSLLKNKKCNKYILAIFIDFNLQLNRQKNV